LDVLQVPRSHAGTNIHTYTIRCIYSMVTFVLVFKCVCIFIISCKTIRLIAVNTLLC